MKNRRKRILCLNCGTSLTESDNYCRNCGQENHQYDLKLRDLLSDFFQNYFSFDSRFGRSLKPFFFNPGFLTTAFVEGKRIRYANPIRWYLVISLIHFFLFSYITAPDSDFSRSKKGAFILNSNVEYDSASQQGNVNVSIDTSSGWQPMTDDEIYVINKMIEADTFSLSEILDSIKAEDKPFFDKLFTKQMVKANFAGADTLNVYLLSKIPLILFFILPVYGLILKLFFYKKGHYILHLVHSLHLHSFLFAWLSFVWLIYLAGVQSPHLIWVSLLILSIYFIISLRKVYSQKYSVLILKYLVTGTFYTILSTVVLVVGIIISTLLF